MSIIGLVVAADLQDVDHALVAAGDRLETFDAGEYAFEGALTVTGRGAMTYHVSLNKYTFTQTSVTSNPGNVTVTSDIVGTRSATMRRINN